VPDQANCDTAPMSDRGGERNQTLILPPALLFSEMLGPDFQIRLAGFNSRVTNPITQ
jgi:hypothetical protein